MGIGSFIYSMFFNEYVLIFFCLLVGMGDFMIFVNLVLILSQWFKGNEFVKLLGLIGLVGSVGLLLVIVFLFMWILFLGWRVFFFSIGLVLMVVFYLFYVVLVVKFK